MTSTQRLLWSIIAVVSTVIFCGLTVTAFAWGRGWDWAAYFRSPARTGVIVVSLLLTVVALFANSGGMNPGKKEDRGNRWIFTPILLLSLGLALLPPYLDGRDLWTTDDVVTPYIGLALLAAGGALRLAPVFVLGRRFTGLVAIQEGHRLETGGLYRLIRHPSYAGLLLFMVGYVLVFRCWLGLLLAVAMFLVLVGRMNAEERLLESEFGEEYAAYRRHTWRLVPWVY